MPKTRWAEVRRSPTLLRLTITDSSRCHAQRATDANVVRGRDESARETSDARRADGGVPTKAPNVKRSLEPYAGQTMAGGALGEWARCRVRWKTAGSGCVGAASGVVGPSSIGNVIGGGAAVPAAANTQGAS